MTAPAAIVAPESVAAPDEDCRSDEQSGYAAGRVLPPVRQAVFSSDLVTSAVRIFEQRLKRSVSDGEARMLLARLVDFVRLGVDGFEDNPRGHEIVQSELVARAGVGRGDKPEGR